MNTRLEEVLNYLDAERTALREAVELVPAELRDQQPGPDRWSVAQVLQHLLIIEKRIVTGVSKWVAEAKENGLGPELESSSVLSSLDLAMIADRTSRRTAPEEVRPKAEMDAASAWTALEQSRQALHNGVLVGDGLALSEVIQPHPVLGPINIYQWLLFVGSHEIRHTAQIREIVGELSAGSSKATGAS